MEILIPLQTALPPSKLRRTLDDVKRSGVDLLEQASSVLLQYSENPNPFVVADYGCGSGTTVEELTRRLEVFCSQKGIRRSIEAIGVDLNPVPSMMRRDVLHIHPETGEIPAWAGEWLEVFGFHRPPVRTRFVQSDLARLVLPDGSVDFGFSIGALAYVPDALRAIEHAVRVMRPGGSAVWGVGEHDISMDPDFFEILDDTPGAHDVFTYTVSPVHRQERLLCARKPSSGQTEFRGFPYALRRVCYISPCDSQPLHAQYYAGTIYGHI